MRAVKGGMGTTPATRFFPASGETSCQKQKKTKKGNEENSERVNIFV